MRSEPKRLKASSCGLRRDGEIELTLALSDGSMASLRVDAVVLGNMIARSAQVLAAKALRVDQRAKALTELAEMDAEHI
jgi:hypothetical protein